MHERCADVLPASCLVDDHLLDVTGITGHGGGGQQQGHADDRSVGLGD